MTSVSKTSRAGSALLPGEVWLAMASPLGDGEVDAVRVKAIHVQGGLAVTEWRDTWRLVHVVTGMLVAQAPSGDEAVRLHADVVSACDWTVWRPKPPPEALKAIGAVREAWQRQQVLTRTGLHGSSIAAVAREVGVSESKARGWKRQAARQRGPAD